MYVFFAGSQHYRCIIEFYPFQENVQVACFQLSIVDLSVILTWRNIPEKERERAKNEIGREGLLIKIVVLSTTFSVRLVRLRSMKVLVQGAAKWKLVI